LKILRAISGRATYSGRVSRLLGYNGFVASDSALALIARYDGNMGDIADDVGVAPTVCVGGYRPNAFGLYDMLGNAQEWCDDGFVDELGTENAEDPTGDAASSSQIARGGGFAGGRAFYQHSGPYSDEWWIAYNIKLYLPIASVQGCRCAFRLGVSRNGIPLSGSAYHPAMQKKVKINNSDLDTKARQRYQSWVEGSGIVYEMNGLRFAWIIE